MAKTDVSKAHRARAERYRTLAGLHDRLAAQEELAENLRAYGQRLSEIDSSVARLRDQIAVLERDSGGPAERALEAPGRAG